LAPVSPTAFNSLFQLGLSNFPAVEFFLTHGHSSVVDITIQDATQKFLAAKQTQKKLSHRTLEDYDSVLGR
jgi:hypothetical protein